MPFLHLARNSSFSTAQFFLRRPLIFALFASLLFWSISLWFSSLVITPLSDAWDYAQLARNILAGHPFQSDFTHPLMLARNPHPPFQTLWRLPLHPLLCSAALFISGGDDARSVIFASGFSFVLAAVVFAGILRGLFQPRIVLFGVLLFASAPMLLPWAVGGLAEPLYILFLLLMLLSLIKGEAKKAGLFLGLSWLTKSNTVFLLPAVALWYMLEEGSWRKRFSRAALTFAVMAIVCSPWWYRNFRLAGDPSFNMTRMMTVMFSERWPGHTLFRTVRLPGEPAMIFSLPDVIHKTLHNLWSFALLERLRACNPVLLLFALAGLVLMLIRRRESPLLTRFALFVIVADVCTMASLSLIVPTMRLYAHVLPFLIIAVCFVADVAIRSGRRFLPIIIAVLLLSQSAYLIKYWRHLSSEKCPALTSEEITRLEREIPADGVIISDLPDYLAWTLHRNTLWLPTWSSFPKVYSLDLNIAAVHLSPFLDLLVDDGGPGERLWLEPDGFSEALGLEPMMTDLPSGHRFYRLRR